MFYSDEESGRVYTAKEVKDLSVKQLAKRDHELDELQNNLTKDCFNDLFAKTLPIAEPSVSPSKESEPPK